MLINTKLEMNFANSRVSSIGSANISSAIGSANNKLI